MSLVRWVYLLAPAWVLTGCSAECTRALDCAADEVCYKEVCTPALAEYARCTGHADCNDGEETGPFECLAGTCRLVSTSGGGGPADSGVADTGTTPPDSGTATPADAGTPPVDAGLPACATAVVRYEATDFATGWSHVEVVGITRGAASFTAGAQQEGANAFLESRITVAENSELWVQSTQTSATYDPALGQGVAWIRGGFDLKWTEPAQTPSRHAVAVLAIVQANTVFWTEDRARANTGEGWVTSPVFDDSMFTKSVGSGPRTLDLSTAGAPMTFGVLTGGSHTTGAPMATRYNGVDNWWVEVCPR